MQKGKSRSVSDAYLVGPGSFPQTYQQNCENRIGAGLSRGRRIGGGGEAAIDTAMQTLSGTGQRSPSIWLCREPRTIHGVCVNATLLHFAEAPRARWVVALGEAVPILARAGCRSFCAWINEPTA